MFLLPRVSSQRAVVGATVLLLVAVLVLLQSAEMAERVLLPLAVAALLAAAGLAWRQRSRVVRGWGERFRSGRELLLHLSPVALLTVVFPFASGRIAQADVGGTSLTTVLLASSLTVPWLSQAVCLPLYRAIGHLILAGDMRKIEKRFCETWLWTLIQSFPVVLLFVVPVQLVFRFPPAALATYVALCLLHVVFVQSLIITNVARRRGRWAAAWAGYALALAVVPTWWFLPPLVGLAVSVSPLLRDLVSLRQLARMDHRDVAADLLRGVLLGAVLWADKLLLFLVTGGAFAVQTIFIAMLPAVLAYNFYFVRLAPGFDESVGTLRTSMERDTHAALVQRSRGLADLVTRSIAVTGLIGAGLALVATVVAASVAPGQLSTVGLVAVASWAFMMITVLCYKLDYVGQRAVAQAISGAHLLACLVVFSLASGVAVTYSLLLVVDGLVFVAALGACLFHWRHPEYTLFWRHATAW